MGQTERVRNRLALAALIAVSACSSGGSHAGKQALDIPSAVTTDKAPTASSASSAPASDARTAVSTSTPTPATSVAKPPAAAPVGPLATTAPGTVAAARATAQGRYTLEEKGTVTLGNPGTPQDASGASTLTVDALKNGLQHSALHSDNTGDTEENLLVRSTGTYAASLKLTSPAFTKEFRPSPAVLLVPEPAKVGAAWSWNTTSTDGKTTAAATNKIGPSQTITIGGTKVVCVVIQTHLVLAGDIDYTTDITTYWSPEYRLPVKTHSTGKGSYNNIPFTTDITGTMRSVKPA